MWRVYVTRRVPQVAVDLLRTAKCDISLWDNDSTPVSRKELLQNVRDKDALFCLITDRIDNEVLEQANRLKVIGTMSVGHEHIDLDACKKRGIKVGYTPGVLTDATAELTIGLLLATSRRLSESINAVKNGEWSSWSPLWLCGTGVSNAVCGIVGLGRIGQKVAGALHALGARELLYTGPREKADEARTVNARYVDFDCLLRESDFVVVTCPLSASTRRMFNESAFSKMKETAIFINTSRGGLVDQAALLAALRERRIAAAGLDVTDPEPLPPSDPLLTLPNCLVLPHIGSATLQTRFRMAELTAQNIIAALRDEELPHRLV